MIFRGAPGSRLPARVSSIPYSGGAKWSAIRGGAVGAIMPCSLRLHLPCCLISTATKKNYPVILCMYVFWYQIVCVCVCVCVCVPECVTMYVCMCRSVKLIYVVPQFMAQSLIILFGVNIVLIILCVNCVKNVL